MSLHSISLKCGTWLLVIVNLVAPVFCFSLWACDRPVLTWIFLLFFTTRGADTELSNFAQQYFFHIMTNGKMHNCNYGMIDTNDASFITFFIQSDEYHWSLSLDLPIWHLLINPLMHAIITFFLLLHNDLIIIRELSSLTLILT